jgi:SAM-dependent methyltransferase
MKDFWNSRYASNEYVFGTEPNVFFKEQLDKIKPGKLLIPADGEGRNAVYAAQKGWQVDASDISNEGKKKAELLANKKEVTIDYKVGDFSLLNYENEHYDAAALVFAHFPAHQKPALHKKIDYHLKPGGYLILEAFNKEHLKYNIINPQIGGPRDFDMLYSLDELLSDFKGYKIIMAEDTIGRLSEGNFHKGTGSMTRFVAQKPI